MFDFLVLAKGADLESQSVVMLLEFLLDVFVLVPSFFSVFNQVLYFYLFFEVLDFVLELRNVITLTSLCNLFLNLCYL